MTHHVNLDGLVLEHGAHKHRRDGVCLMEAVAWFAGRPHSDAPQCVSPALRLFGVRLNDALPHDRRQQLIPLIPALIGTAGDGHDDTRGWMCLDWLVRVSLPTWLRSTPELTGHADRLSALPVITSRANWTGVKDVVHAACEAAVDARSQAYQRLRAAAADADAAAAATATAAATAAAAALTDAATTAAATATATAAATALTAAAAVVAAVVTATATAAAGGKQFGYDEIRTWVREQLKPTVEELQGSLIALYGDLISAGT